MAAHLLFVRGSRVIFAASATGVHRQVQSPGETQQRNSLKEPLGTARLARPLPENLTPTFSFRASDVPPADPEHS